MNRYIATFHSHFGALSYVRALEKQGTEAKPMPVPRKVSSSCGTCVFYLAKAPIIAQEEELDAIYLEREQGLEIVYQS